MNSVLGGGFAKGLAVLGRSHPPQLVTEPQHILCCCGFLNQAEWQFKLPFGFSHCFFIDHGTS